MVTLTAQIETMDEFDVRPQTETLTRHLHHVDPSDPEDLQEQGYKVLSVDYLEA